jgi:hypothetical protein
MDLTKTIEELRRDKEKLERVIASLEELRATGDVLARKRRGRKSVSIEERREVSAKMKKYRETQPTSRLALTNGCADYLIAMKAPQRGFGSSTKSRTYDSAGAVLGLTCNTRRSRDGVYGATSSPR